MSAARVSGIAGFVATSNVEAARRFGLNAAGTMAHSYVQAFPTEVDAFRAFAEDFPRSPTFLVDTYDTAGGVRAAIKVIRDLGLTGNLGVRLDSGDLPTLARATRMQLDSAGLRNVRIFVSGGLDEYDLERFRADGVPIDAAGIGTRMGVSADAPSLDSAYKLVAFGDRPVFKLSAGKVTLPGAKQVWRHLPDADLLALRDEPGLPGREPLLIPVMRNGVRVGAFATIEDARRRLSEDLGALLPSQCNLREPMRSEPVVSERLRSLAAELTARSRPGYSPPESSER
jgi:nicotinate phosphoribosyltransferase